MGYLTTDRDRLRPDIVRLRTYVETLRREWRETPFGRGAWKGTIISMPTPTPRIRQVPVTMPSLAQHLAEDAAQRWAPVRDLLEQFAENSASAARQDREGRLAYDESRIPAGVTRDHPPNDCWSPTAGDSFVATPAIEHLAVRALACFSIRQAVPFAGPAGTGKTTRAFHVAAQPGRLGLQ